MFDGPERSQCLAKGMSSAHKEYMLIAFLAFIAKNAKFSGK